MTDRGRRHGRRDAAGNPQGPWTGSLSVLGAFFYDPHPDFGANPRPFVALMLIGFVIGVAGHVVKSRTLIATGIGLIFMGTFLLPLAANLSNR